MGHVSTAQTPPPPGPPVCIARTHCRSKGSAETSPQRPRLHFFEFRPVSPPLLSGVPLTAPPSPASGRTAPPPARSTPAATWSSARRRPCAKSAVASEHPPSRPFLPLLPRFNLPPRFLRPVLLLPNPLVYHTPRRGRRKMCISLTRNRAAPSTRCRESAPTISTRQGRYRPLLSPHPIPAPSHSRPPRPVRVACNSSTRILQFIGSDSASRR